jgi:hypothetical protein
MQFKDLFPSAHLAVADILAPVTVRITELEIQEIRDDDGNKKKPVLHFERCTKTLVLNRINGEMLCELYGEDTDNWIGQPIEIYVDQNVTMNGRKVGGLRLREPPGPTSKTVRAAAPSDERRANHDGIPF